MYAVVSAYVVGVMNARWCCGVCFRMHVKQTPEALCVALPVE